MVERTMRVGRPMAMSVVAVLAILSLVLDSALGRGVLLVACLLSGALLYRLTAIDPTPGETAAALASLAVAWLLTAFSVSAYDAGPGRTDWIEPGAISVALSVIVVSGLMILGVILVKQQFGSPAQHNGLTAVAASAGLVAFFIAQFLIGYDVPG